jgi:sensor histidine kinase YesM
MVIFLLSGCGGGATVDQYEKLVDEAISIMKKAKVVDIREVTDGAKLLEQIENLQSELEDKEDDLSEAELERFEKAKDKSRDLV